MFDAGIKSSRAGRDDSVKGFKCLVNNLKTFQRYNQSFALRRASGCIISFVRVETFSTVLGLILMPVCGSTSQTPAVAESGIEGAITISPANPGPIRVDAPGWKPLANTTFMVEDKNTEVTSFTTDDQGRFRVSLSPGHYKVLLKGRKTSIGRFGPFEVDVALGKMTKVEWKCDSGIR
jgi:hypothetical protein